MMTQDKATVVREFELTVGPEAADLLSLLETEVVTWRPDQGHPTAVAGKVVGMTEFDSGYGSYPVIDLFDGHVIWRVHALGGVLENELARLNVKGGDKLGVAFLGMAKLRNPKAGQNAEYRNYRIVHRPASS